MNWYKLADFPLPSVTNEYPPRSGFNPLNMFDRDMGQESAQQFNQSYPDASFLGTGAQGIAYNVQQGHVAKLTNNGDEAGFANWLIKSQLPCCVRIYKVQQVQKQPPLWSIEMDKVNTLSPEDKNIVMSVIEAIDGYESSVAFNPNDQGQVNDVWSVVSEWLRIKTMPKVALDYFKMLQCFKNAKVMADDAHESNVGYTSDGRLVLFDLGSTT